METAGEKIIKSKSGYFFLFLAIALLFFTIAGITLFMQPLSVLFILGFFFILPGFFIISPNESAVLTLFGKYVGTVKENGFFWANPFYSKKKISLRARNFDSERLKVNDKIGNPIIISIILVWRVKDTYKAAFEVDDYENFVRIQSDAAVRKLAGMYPYDNFDDEEEQLTLRAGGEKVNQALEKELEDRLKIAGIEILEARIAYLAYAEEIANAMLKRQQASAIIAARKKIVEGAVGMVEDALEKLSNKELIHLTQEQKSRMVSNLMVVLCSDKETIPVVNASDA